MIEFNLQNVCKIPMNISLFTINVGFQVVLKDILLARWWLEKWELKYDGRFSELSLRWLFGIINRSNGENDDDEFISHDLTPQDTTQGTCFFFALLATWDFCCWGLWNPILVYPYIRGNRAERGPGRCWSGRKLFYAMHNEFQMEFNYRFVIYHFIASLLIAAFLTFFPS